MTCRTLSLLHWIRVSFLIYGFSYIQHFCTAELAGAFAVYLTTERAGYLNGRFVSVNWDIEELEARKDEIILEGLLTEGLKGVFSA